MFPFRYGRRNSIDFSKPLVGLLVGNWLVDANILQQDCCTTLVWCVVMCFVRGWDKPSAY